MDHPLHPLQTNHLLQKKHLKKKFATPFKHTLIPGILSLVLSSIPFSYTIPIVRSGDKLGKNIFFTINAGKTTMFFCGCFFGKTPLV
jgi:hypothetical protein